jgi:hypothetical protein
MDVLATALVSLIFGGLGAYFGSYLGQKGKNLATKEDLDRVVRKTEEIKAEIARDMSIGLRRRELQIEVLKEFAGASTQLISAVNRGTFADLAEEAKYKLMTSLALSKALFSDETHRYVDDFIATTPPSANPTAAECVPRLNAALKAMVEEIICR